MNIEVKIEKYDHQGRGIGYYNNKIVFIPNTLIGEVVLIEITKEKKSYYEGRVINYIKKSNARIEVSCPYYEKCGGCNFLHTNYENEINIKANILKDILKRYADLEVNPTIIKSNLEKKYRNKITLKIKNNEWGYYNEESHDFVKIDNCLLAKDSINKIIESKDLFKIENGSIIIRSNYNDEIIIKIDTLDNYEIDIDELRKNNKIDGIIVNDKIIYGEDYYIERVNNLLFRVNINSFFQINLDILKEVFKLLNKEKYNAVVDLYCGVGTLGIAVNKDKLYGIEIVKEGVIDALKNAKMNKQNSNNFLLGDASSLSKINDNIDMIIIDPPRSGLNEKTLNEILKVMPKSVVYMSCNPITLARDLNVFKNYYDINVTMLDMFPRTKHLESICILEKI